MEKKRDKGKSIVLEVSFKEHTHAMALLSMNCSKQKLLLKVSDYKIQTAIQLPIDNDVCFRSV
jgi:hypothetical protein